MANLKAPNLTQQGVVSSPEPQLEEQSTQRGWIILLKALFWFIVTPTGVLLVAKWLIQAVSGDPSFFGN